MLKKIYCCLHRKFSRPEQDGEYSSGYWQERIRQEALILCRGMQGKVLEVGCGEGLFLIPLAKESPHLEIWGIDNSSVRLGQVKQRAQENNLKNISASLQEAATLSFANEYFDAVVCINVFFNLESPALVKQVLQEMKRVCKKSGKIFFDFRNALNPLLLLKYRLARYYDTTVKDLPLRCYRPQQIEVLLKDLDLAVVHKIFIDSPLFKQFAPIVIIEAEKK